ncbi:MAG: ATP-binding protein [Opitutaceae bacterium]
MTPDSRRDPDALLAAARVEDEKRVRGEPRVYLGMCPGVGKTYTMLDDGRHHATSGRVVLVGLAETHGRAETEALMAGLEVLPRREISYRGTTLSEFDLDAALARRPELVLVDELAHTNAPGSRHPKRWQDVRELLESGIDVWTTVNIQHVESLRDEVAKITGIRVQETLPDSFFDFADEIRLVDLTPDQLRRRLREGKVYLGDSAQDAARNFFREGNLSALREMALRFTAQRVDREMRDYMRRHLIEGPWRSGERLLVAVGSSPFSERLIRLTRRLAASLRASWLAVHVEAGESAGEESRGRLAANLALARSLGAEVISVGGGDTAAAILEVARRENVSQIVVGKPLGLPWWQRILGRSIADRLTRESGEIDLVLVHPNEAHDISESRRVRRDRAAMKYRSTEWATVAGLLAGATVAGLLSESWIGYRSIPMLYLLVITLAGLFLHRWAVLLLAFASALTWSFFFTEPRVTLTMLHREDFFLLFAFLAVAFVLGHLTTRLRRREQASREGEERASTLYQLTRSIAASVDFAQGVRRALRQIHEVFNAEPALVLVDQNGGLEPAAGAAMSARELSVCHWAATHRRASGRFTDTLPESSILAIPLLADGRAAGVLIVRPKDETLQSPLRQDLLEAFGAHLSVLIEKESFQRSAREGKVAAASQKLQRALLDQVSHELKTPVAVIGAAAQRLSSAPSDDPGMIEEIKQAAVRLNRVVTQLVTLSRVEAGLIQPQIEVCDARDLLDEVVADMGSSSDRVRISCEDFEFRADPGLLHTAIGNLLSNAVQYSPKDAPVILKARREDTGRACFEVTNQGVVITAEERRQIFERFARGAAARPGGMGLGLSIARHFIEALGGRVELAESGGDGTTFRILLPRESVVASKKDHS